MKNFNIDDQTFKDLNIFTGTLDSDSIFSTFKGTRTDGGRERLREMMQKPSSDIQELTLRKDSIKYFYDLKINLDIRNEEIDLVEFYLKFSGNKFRSNLIDSLAEYLTKDSSNDYYIIKTGLKYLIKLTKYISTFIEEHSTDNTPEYLNIIFKKITLIIEDGLLKEAMLLNENKLKFLQVSKLDRAFRGIEKDHIKTFLQLVYELDIFENLARIAVSAGLSFPEYTAGDDLKVCLNGFFHPGISNPVKNDLVFDADQNMIFLTGSNMAGKSSLLKSIGLIIYLAHIGFPVPADHMETTVFNGLITTINLPDDMNKGLSHYYSEIKRIKDVSKMLLEADRIFVIFDELFRGTNIKDAFDASLLIISELSTVRNSVFFVSTHIVELADELKNFRNISFRYLESYLENNKPVFTYQLMNGISTGRLGMVIFLNEGIVELIRAASVKFEKSNIIAKN